MTTSLDDVPAPVSAEQFRSLMGTVCSQVTVVTTLSDAGRPYGTTVSAFCSLSLAPPMVTVALDRGSRLLSAVGHTRRVGINLLGEGQDELAARFASKAEDKFGSLPWDSRDGVPHLEGTAGWLAGEVADFVEGGDHIILLCLVTSAAAEERRPLVYGHRRFGTHSGLLAP